MRRAWIVLGVTLLCLLAWLSIPQAAGDLKRGDHWMLVGSYSWRGGQGIYLFRFDVNGDVQPANLAAGRIWQANHGAWGGSLPRLIAQLREGWRGPQNPADLAVHPNQRFVYSADENAAGAVSAFRIDPANGKLTPLNTKPSGGPKPCFVTVAPGGRRLLVANYGGSVAVLPIEPDGRLGDATSVIRYPAGSQAHSINLSPDNFAVVTDAGLDQVHVYRFNDAHGTLTPHNDLAPPLPHGSRPRHLVFHPYGRWAYLITESSTVVAMTWNDGLLTPMQTISTLPADYHGEAGAAEIEVHPYGRFLYASNRGHDSIAVFDIDQRTGKLTAKQDISTQGAQPASFRIDPSGHVLFVANVIASNIVKFRIDPQTGLLSPTGPPLPAVAPVSIRFIPSW